MTVLDTNMTKTSHSGPFSQSGMHSNHDPSSQPLMPDMFIANRATLTTSARPSRSEGRTW